MRMLLLGLLFGALAVAIGARSSYFKEDPAPIPTPPPCTYICDAFGCYYSCTPDNQTP